MEEGGESLRKFGSSDAQQTQEKATSTDRIKERGARMQNISSELQVRNQFSVLIGNPHESSEEERVTVRQQEGADLQTDLVSQVQLSKKNRPQAESQGIDVPKQNNKGQQAQAKNSSIVRVQETQFAGNDNSGSTSKDQCNNYTQREGTQRRDIGPSLIPRLTRPARYTPTVPGMGGIVCLDVSSSYTIPANSTLMKGAVRSTEAGGTAVSQIGGTCVLINNQAQKGLRQVEAEIELVCTQTAARHTT